MALPWPGHIQEVYHMFSYLKKHHNAEVVFDSTHLGFYWLQFEHQDWMYSAYCKEDLKEELPPKMPKPHGPGFAIRVYVDADYAGDLATCRSRTGFVEFLNRAPIYWFSKKQGSLETSTFGSELCAMKVTMEYVRGLRYKLWMMEIPVDEPEFFWQQPIYAVQNI